ncbi:MAG: MarC family protein [Hyphomicrobiales bacterium]
MLLVISDPVFMSALFLGLTSDMTPEHRKEVALRGAIIAFCILLAAGLGGAKLLTMLGISLAAFRIAGGLLLLVSSGNGVVRPARPTATGWAKTAVTIDHIRNIAAFPLAIPLMAGPGAITAMILLAGRADGDLMKLTALYAVAAGVMLACYLCFRIAVPISKTLGITGRAVISRLLGIILAALAVQFVIDGVTSLLK